MEPPIELKNRRDRTDKPSRSATNLFPEGIVAEMKKEDPKVTLDVGSFEQVDRFLRDPPRVKRLILELEEHQQDPLADCCYDQLDLVYRDCHEFLPLLFGIGLRVITNLFLTQVLSSRN